MRFPDFRMPQLVFQFVITHGRITRHQNAAESRCSQQGDDPLRQVGEVDRDAIAALDAKVGQNGGEGRCFRIYLGIGESAESQGQTGPVRMSLHRLGKTLRQMVTLQTPSLSEVSL